MTVTTDRGAVTGSATALGRAFLGIPFAAPPVGPLRWAPPQEAAAWREPRDATRLGPACLQLDGDAVRTDTSEDCLTLEVWTPPGDARGLPVMVWIPGGAFVQGGGGFPLYDGARLAARERVIVVALNYRLGPFGFLALPELAREQGRRTMPSLGLLDQRAALRWVQRNIARFGGDPANVTIFGESAGAWSVCAHLAMPASRGLFARAIMQSGACSDALYFDAETAEAQGRELAKAVGCADVACLRAVPAETLLRALPGRRGFILAPGAWWGPVVDGVELRAQPLTVLREDPAAGVPLLTGWNRDEGTLHTIGFPTVSTDELTTFVREAFGARGPEVLASYPRDTPKLALTDVITDGVFACNVRRVARVLAGRGVPVYQYELVHALDHPIPHPLGATHSVDLWFVFGNSDLGIGLSEAEQPLAHLIMDAWGRFARTGDPGGPSLRWPRYTAAADELLVLDTAPSVAAHVKSDMCDAWDRAAR